MATIDFWDDLDCMIDEMRNRPYNWDTSGDFPAESGVVAWQPIEDLVGRSNELYEACGVKGAIAFSKPAAENRAKEK